MAAAELIRPVTGGVTLEILASPGSSVSRVRSVHGNTLKVAVRAAPEKGKANAEIEEVLAAFFGVPQSQVAVISGQTSRNKRVQINGVDAAAASAKIAQL
ncbi:MAG TPA: DUF167 domain-containing protein [Planctomycetota bacterium]|nr:DUF167 domain-containing protein [Planctomycetota bacterium]